MFNLVGHCWYNCTELYKTGSWINFALYILVNQGFITLSPLQASGHLFCLINFTVWKISQLHWHPYYPNHRRLTDNIYRRLFKWNLVKWMKRNSSSFPSLGRNLQSCVRDQRGVNFSSKCLLLESVIVFIYYSNSGKGNSCTQGYQPYSKNHHINLVEIIWVSKDGVVWHSRLDYFVFSNTSRSEDNRPLQVGKDFKRSSGQALHRKKKKT